MKKLAIMGAVLGMLTSYVTGQALAQRFVSPSQVTVPAYLEKAFAATRSQLTGYEVHDWTTLSASFLPERQLRQADREVAVRLGVRHLKLYAHSDPHDHVALWTGTYAANPVRGARAEDVKATVEMASLAFADAPSQTVLIVRLLASTNKEAGFAAAYAAVARVADKVTGHAEINATLFGSIPRLLDTHARAKRIHSAFIAAGARPLQSMTYTYTTSVSGYGAGGVPALHAGKQNINLQVALHENGYKDVTRVLVGSPIITVEY